MKTVINILMLGVFINSSLPGQSDLDLRYNLITIDSLLNGIDTTKYLSITYDFKDKDKTNEHFLLNADFAKKRYQLVVVFEDTIKSMDKIDMRFIEVWGKVFGIKPELREIYNKLLCSINGKLYWVFIQEKMIQYYQSELTKNDNVKLYIMFLGTMSKGSEFRYIMVANDFRKISGTISK